MILLWFLVEMNQESQHLRNISHGRLGGRGEGMPKEVIDSRPVLDNWSVVVWSAHLKMRLLILIQSFR